MWFLSTTDPLCTTDHLHQRLVERTSSGHGSLAEAQDSLSILWPALLELGQQRRGQGRRGGVTNFVTPWADGILFGDMQRLEMTAEVAEAAAPTLLDCQNRLCLKHQLHDFFCNGRERLMVQVRTFVSGDQLKGRQPQLKATLDRYVRRNRAVLECLRGWTRLAFDAQSPYGPALRDLFSDPRLTEADFPKALEELELDYFL